MRSSIALLVTLSALSVSVLAFASGCMTRCNGYCCDASLAHPTMTSGPILIGREARVYLFTEGATGQLGIAESN